MPASFDGAASDCVLMVAASTWKKSMTTPSSLSSSRAEHVMTPPRCARPIRLACSGKDLVRSQRGVPAERVRAPCMHNHPDNTARSASYDDCAAPRISHQRFGRGPYFVSTLRVLPVSATQWAELLPATKVVYATRSGPSPLVCVSTRDD